MEKKWVLIEEAELDAIVEELESLRALQHEVGRCRSDEIPAPVFYAWKGGKEYLQSTIKTQADRIVELAKEVRIKTTSIDDLATRLKTAKDYNIRLLEDFYKRRI